MRRHLVQFKNIKKLHWQEVGCWPALRNDSYIYVLDKLQEKFRNAAFKISYVIYSDEQPVSYTPVNYKTGRVTILVSFKNKADEAEFMLHNATGMYI
jgi:hypothetical protein